MTTWKWIRASNASGIQDVAAPVNAFGPAIALVGAGGTIWRMDSWNHFVADRGTSDFRRVAMSPDGKWLWGAGTNGTLWYSAAPGQWAKLEAANQLGSPVEDLVMAYDNSLWVTLKSGKMWSTRDGQHWTWRTTLGRFKRLAVGPNNDWWGVDTNGDLWSRDGIGDNDHSYWQTTQGTGVEDVTVGRDGTAWIVGANGTVWKTRDGQAFTQIDASGFYAISIQGDRYIFGVGRNGTFWVYEPVPDPPPGRGGGGGGGGAPADTLLHLRLVDDSAQFNISAVQWTVWRQDLDRFTAVAAPTGSAVDIGLPSNGQYHVRADVRAIRLATGDNELADFRGNGAQVNGFRTLVFVWNGGTQTITVRLITEGAAEGLYNPVVVM